MESKVMQLLDLLADEHFVKAKGLCDDATREINKIESQYGHKLTKSQKEAIGEVRKITENLCGDKNDAARIAASSTSSKYSQHIVGSFLKGRKNVALSKDPQNSRNKPKQDPSGQDSNRNKTSAVNHQSDTSAPKGSTLYKSEQIPKTGKDEARKSTSYVSTQNSRLPQSKETRDLPVAKDLQNSTRPLNDTEGTIADHLDANHRQNQKSKRASQAMIHNNADIADLSDTNRPTKLAERFSELYDNEWTEAFEALSKQKRSEREVIEILLEIVQRAYAFCEKEADEQIAKMQSAFTEILKGKQVTGSRYKGDQHDTGKEFLVHYRKDIAGKAIPRLQEEFYKVPGNNTDRDAKVVKYIYKAVEVAWWMTVQDPPVYMCPTATTEFDPNLYRAYTQSGKTPDFFVWPALRLYKQGGVLIKGVVQYKN